ncbi:MAG: hypothetical protein M3Q60_13115 [Actinomycetota bacterium]|nr:hypothetical protein [Actinomycetota bacterium]
MEPETQRAGEETQAVSEQEEAEREEADERARYVAQKTTGGMVGYRFVVGPGFRSYRVALLDEDGCEVRDREEAGARRPGPSLVTQYRWSPPRGRAPSAPGDGATGTAVRSSEGSRAPSGGYTKLMSLDRLLISLGVLLLIVGAVLAAITWL